MEKLLNKLWFWLNYLKYKKFCQKVEAANYNKENIWWHYRIGFICMPPMDNF